MPFKTLRRASLIVLVPIALSAYTHIWNAAGFPDIFYDEGVYIRRAMNVLYYLEVQESPTYYDHPYFGQIMLAGFFAMIGFPGSVNPSATVASIETIHFLPRLFVGLLSVLDTFLVYKITERRYDAKIAVFAALLFAVMPVSWLTRRVLLDSLMLPLLLSSIYLALCINATSSSKSKKLLLALSGLSLGLAVFTKMPAIAVIPLVVYLVHNNFRQNKRMEFIVWLMPVLIIPMVWPVHSILEGRFDFWLDSMLSQTQRTSERIATILWNFWRIDPVLLALGAAGLVYAARVRRDFFPLLWAGPFLVLYSAVSYAQYFHVIPLIPIFSISSALFIVHLIRRIWVRRAEFITNGVIILFGAFGLVATTALIATNMTSSQFEATAYVLWVASEDAIIVASPAYSWVYNFVLHMPYALGDYREAIYSPILGEEMIVVSDPHFRSSAASEVKLQELLNSTSSIRVFQGDIQNYDVTSFPYTSLSTTGQGELIDIREDSKP